MQISYHHQDQRHFLPPGGSPSQNPVKTEAQPSQQQQQTTVTITQTPGGAVTAGGAPGGKKEVTKLITITAAPPPPAQAPASAPAAEKKVKVSQADVSVFKSCVARGGDDVRDNISGVQVVKLTSAQINSFSHVNCHPAQVVLGDVAAVMWQTGFNCTHRDLLSGVQVKRHFRFDRRLFRFQVEVKAEKPPDSTPTTSTAPAPQVKEDAAGGAGEDAAPGKAAPDEGAGGGPDPIAGLDWDGGIGHLAGSSLKVRAAASDPPPPRAVRRHARRTRSRRDAPWQIFHTNLIWG